MALATVVAMATLLAALPAEAITNGAPDDGAHPYVGMILFTRADGTRTRCSGTLISSRVVLTAAHCTFGKVSARVWFDESVPDLATGGVPGTPFVHPLYDDVLFAPPETHDVGVVVLSKSVKMKKYGVLPHAGIVDSLSNVMGIYSERFAVVGYGRQEVRPDSVVIRARYKAEVVIQNLHNAVVDGFNIQTSGNANAIWSGGTCFGDSGGPIFLNDTNIVIGITSFGNDPNCKSSGFYYRTDIDDTRSFLDDFVPVP